MVVVGPVGDGAESGAALVCFGFEEHGHEGHESAVGTAVDSDAVWVGVVVFNDEVDGVFEVFEFWVSHLSVDRGAPVSAVT